MRAILLILILLVVVAIGAIATGFLNINQRQSAQAPQVEANGSGVAVTGGKAPQFEVETGKIAVGTRESTVKLPSIEVRPAGGGAPAAGNAQGGAPAPANGVATTNSTQP